MPYYEQTVREKIFHLTNKYQIKNLLCLLRLNIYKIIGSLVKKEQRKLYNF